MKWKVKTIGDICEVLGGCPAPKGELLTSDDSGIPFIRMKDLGRYHLTNNLIKVDSFLKKDYVKSQNLKIVPKGSILLPRSGSVALNHRAILGIDSVVVSHICALKVIDSEIDNKFLYYSLSRMRMEKITKQTTGLDAITFEDLKKIKIEYPGLRVQQKIAAILDKADSLRQKDKQLLKLYDDLAQSAFYKMFGDPVKNEKRWNKCKLEEFGDVITGNTPSRDVPENYSPRFIEWIKTDNILENDLFINKATEYLSEVGLAKARTVTDGALLVACIAGSIDSLGRAALTDRKVSFNQQINAIQPNDSVNSIFLFWLFKLSRKYFQDHATSGMKKIITKGEFEKIKMILPPLPIQKDFEIKIKSIQHLKGNMINAELKSESLFQSLLQRAFKGELVKE